ncbi:MAG TPA: sigma-54 dependent transcriptional regulator [Syntrophorhabdaceae bacterium]|nr:sigma-54 dependent transcriptional regulator [Syntrophorhabdaceae bacterium]
MMMNNLGNILLVEDDKNQREIIKTILAKEGFYVEDAGTGKKALEILKANSFDVVLTDLRLPDLDGTYILKEVKNQNTPCQVVIITAFGSIPSAVEATKMGAFYYLEKPFEKDQLLIVIKNAMNQVKLLKDNIMLKDQLFDRFHLDNIIGVHKRMEDLFKIVRRVAPTNSTVIIYGESGTGKELFAKSIHYNSPRKNKPFFAINCAAIPETLLESELFGYEKGAFTGALTRHTGLFEQANGSTLFLDEIGDLTLGTQAKLLRAIQEKEIRRLGGKETIRLDVRIIAATNKRLDEEIKKGNFREDLYYRLNVIAFSIPPLRERATDIPLLIEHFLKRINEVHGVKKTVSNEALKLLMGYSWPGNVRQLESIIERAFIMCEGDVIDVEHIPEEVNQDTLKNIPEQINIPDEGIDFETIEKELIKKAYLKAEGKVSVAARLLNMSYDKLWFKIKKMKEKGELFDFTNR